MLNGKVIIGRVEASEAKDAGSLDGLEGVGGKREGLALLAGEHCPRGKDGIGEMRASERKGRPKHCDGSPLAVGEGGAANCEEGGRVLEGDISCACACGVVVEAGVGDAPGLEVGGVNGSSLVHTSTVLERAVRESEAREAREVEGATLEGTDGGEAGVLDADVISSEVEEESSTIGCVGGTADVREAPE